MSCSDCVIFYNSDVFICKSCKICSRIVKPFAFYEAPDHIIGCYRSDKDIGFYRLQEDIDYENSKSCNREINQNKNKRKTKIYQIKKRKEERENFKFERKIKNSKN